MSMESISLYEENFAISVIIYTSYTNKILYTYAEYKVYLYEYIACAK